jgi:hypothetical protein
VARRRAATKRRARTAAGSRSSVDTGEADIVAVGSIWQSPGQSVVQGGKGQSDSATILTRLTSWPGWVAASRYRIVMRARLSERFESAFDGMALESGPNQTVLVGDVRDQAHLYRLLDRLRESGIELLAVEPAGTSGISCDPGPPYDPGCRE